MLEDTKRKIRSGKSRTDRQYNDTKKKDKGANNDLQKTKDCETRTQPKPGRVSSLCSTCGPVMYYCHNPGDSS